MMSPEEILSAFELAKKSLPALAALHLSLDSLASHEKQDVRETAVAVGRMIYDLREGITALEMAVKA